MRMTHHVRLVQSVGADDEKVIALGDWDDRPAPTSVPGGGTRADV